MIKTIIFDLNKVLITYRKDDDSYIKILGKSREEFWKYRDEYLDKYILDEINFDTFLKIMLEKSNLPLNKLKDIKKIHEEGLELTKGIIPLLEKLKKKYNLILMAGDGYESLNIKIDKFGIRKYFSKIYATCIQKMKKTDSNFYNLILKENNLAPSEVVFVDDRIVYIDAAKKLGIKTILLENNKKLEYELNKII